MIVLVYGDYYIGMDEDYYILYYYVDMYGYILYLFLLQFLMSLNLA